MVAPNMHIVDFRITRFQFARDRGSGDSKVCADDVHVAALELVDSTGRTGLGFVQSLFHPLPAEADLARVFRAEAWPVLEGESALAHAHRAGRPRGRHIRRTPVPFEAALQPAVWVLAARPATMPLWRRLRPRPDRVRAPPYGPNLPE